MTIYRMTLKPKRKGDEIQLTISSPNGREDAVMACRKMAESKGLNGYAITRVEVIDERTN